MWGAKATDGLLLTLVLIDAVRITVTREFFTTVCIKMNTIQTFFKQESYHSKICLLGEKLSGLALAP